MANQLSPRQVLIREAQLMLGEGMIDLYLDPDHYDMAVTMALSRYRQRSPNAVEESYLFIDVQPNVQFVTLPQEVLEVRSLYRSTTGGSAGSTIDPFSMQMSNNLYMMQNPGGLMGGGVGTLLTYDVAMQYQNLVGRMFGRDVQYYFDSSTKKLTFARRFNASETVGLMIYNEKPEAVLIGDYKARPWLRNYTAAACRSMMGAAMSKFSNLAGPQGGVQLNGQALVDQAKAEMEALDIELTTLIDATIAWPVVIG